MIYSRKYEHMVAQLAADWEIILLIDIDTDTLIATATETEMKKFNGFLCFNDMKPFQLVNIVELGQ